MPDEHHPRVSAEVRAHLVALSGKIPYTEHDAVTTNSSDMTVIVMRQREGGADQFIGTVRIHPTIIHNL